MKRSSESCPRTIRSWLPATHAASSPATRSTHSFGNGPYPTRSPARRYPSTPSDRTGSSPACEWLERSVADRAREGKRVVPGDSALRFAGEHPGNPAPEGHVLCPYGLGVAPGADPADSGLRRGGRRARKPDEVAVDELGDVHSRGGARVVPEVEAGGDLQQVEALVLRVALEVELGDTAQLDALDDVPSELGDVRRVGQDERRAVAVMLGKGADLLAGELSGDGALLVDVDVVALDQALRPGDELLHDYLDTGLLEPGKEGVELLARVALDDLRPRDRLPVRMVARHGLDDDREVQVELG